jgi:hypothetical protein
VQINHEIWSEEISEAEIKSVCKKLKNNKMPGIDNITGEMLKADKETLIKWLKKIFITRSG